MFSLVIVVNNAMSFQGSWRSQLEYGQYNRREGSKDKSDRLFKRTIKRSKSVVDLMLFGSKFIQNCVIMNDILHM